MSYKLVSEIDVRTVKESKGREYIVKAVASVPNTPDIYKIVHGPNGPRGVKSIFTSNAIESMKRQSKAKSVFVDAKHEIATVINLRGLLKSKGLEDSFIDDVVNRIKRSDIPLASLHDINTDEEGRLIIDTRFNPHFKELDEDHKNYFDSVWGSIEDGHIKGVSINFKPTKIEQVFQNGQYVDMIDDVDLFGYSYESDPALPENSIFEVAIRSIIETREGTRMEEKGTPATPAQQPVDVEKLKEEIIKEMEAKEAQRKTLEEEKAKQAETLANLQKELEAKAAKIKELEDKANVPPPGVPGAKGIVPPQGNPHIGNQGLQREEFIKKLDSLSLGELIALQGEFNTAKLYPQEKLNYLGGGADVVIKPNR